MGHGQWRAIRGLDVARVSQPWRLWLTTSVVSGPTSRIHLLVLVTPAIRPMLSGRLHAETQANVPHPRCPVVDPTRLDIQRASPHPIRKDTFGTDTPMSFLVAQRAEAIVFPWCAFFVARTFFSPLRSRAGTGRATSTLNSDMRLMRFFPRPPARTPYTDCVSATE